jgi:hypothetical protein
MTNISFPSTFLPHQEDIRAGPNVEVLNNQTYMDGRRGETHQQQPKNRGQRAKASPGP